MQCEGGFEIDLVAFFFTRDADGLTISAAVSPTIWAPTTRFGRAIHDHFIRCGYRGLTGPI